MALDASAQKNRAMPEQMIRKKMRFCLFMVFIFKVKTMPAMARRITPHTNFL
jgi:hypothetical protein